MIGGAEVDEEIVDLVLDFFDARVGTIDLVDADEHLETRLERLPEHEARLGERPFARVDEEQRAVDHLHDPLDLAAEVGVARRVDDVDLDALYRTAVALDMIVIPRSRSRSIESITRSAWASPARHVPACLSRPSTSVVFPWSTWAMIATLRMSGIELRGRPS